MADHTPGPWIVFVDRGANGEIYSILPAGRAGTIADNITEGANADLIASAPKLFELVEYLQQNNKEVFAAAEAKIVELKEALKAALHSRPGWGAKAKALLEEVAPFTS